MIHVVWEFRVREDSVPAFEGRYSGRGAWVKLFARACLGRFEDLPGPPPRRS